MTPSPHTASLPPLIIFAFNIHFLLIYASLLNPTMKLLPALTLQFGWPPCDTNTIAWKLTLLLNALLCHQIGKQLVSVGVMLISITLMVPSFLARRRLDLLHRDSVSTQKIMAIPTHLLRRLQVSVWCLPMLPILI